jgi:O-antigen/teichoic acid export membrane protein
MRAAGIYLMTRVVAGGFGLLAVMIYTRLLEPQAYGLYALLISAVFALFEILFRWICASTVRFLPSASHARSPVLGAAIGGYAIIAAFVVLATLALLLTGATPLTPRLLLLSAAVLLAHAAGEVMLAVVQARQRPGLYSVLVASRAAGIVGIGTLMLLLGYGVEGLLIGFLLANAAPILVLVVRHAGDLLASRCEPARLRTFAAFGLPIAIVGISGTCIAISDRYVIAALLGVDAAGFYAAPYDLAFRSLNMVMLGCFLALSPLVFRSFDSDGEGVARQHLISQAQLHLMAGLPLAFLLGLGAPVVSRVAFGDDFRATADELMPWFAAAAFLQGLQAFYISYLFTIYRRTLANAAICVGAALVNLGLNFLLVPSVGLVGAAIATLISYGLVIAASVIGARRWMTLPWPVADMLKVGCACAGAAPLAIAARLTDSLPLGVLALGTALAVTLGLIVLLDTAGMRARAVAAIRQWRVPHSPGAGEVKTTQTP